MEDTPEELRTTTVKAYLVIARYNRAKWKALRSNSDLTVSMEAAVGASTAPGTATSSHETAREQAEHAAEYLFPEQEFPLTQLAWQDGSIGTEPSSQEYLAAKQRLEKMWVVHTFHSNLHAEVKRISEEKGGGNKGKGKGKGVAGGGYGNEEMEARVDALFDEPLTSFAPGTSVLDPGIGWIAIVEANAFGAMVEEMAAGSEPLWRMYDIEAIPLNSDRTTLDIYQFMTPVNWN